MADVFADALSFRPERWLDDGERLDRYLHIFDGGTRVCLGMALAYGELFLLVAELFRRWGSGGVVSSSDDGDRRPGDVGVIKIYESTPRDYRMASDYFVPIPYKVRAARAGAARAGNRRSALTGSRAARGSDSCSRRTDEARARAGGQGARVVSWLSWSTLD